MPIGRLGIPHLAGCALSLAVSLGLATPAALAQDKPGERPQLVLNYFGIAAPDGSRQPGRRLILDLGSGSAVSAPAAGTRFNIYFGGYSTQLDASGKSEVRKIAASANRLRASRVEILADPGATAVARANDAYVRASSVRLELKRYTLPAETVVSINREPGIGTPVQQASTGLIKQSQRVEIIIHPGRNR